MALSEPAAAAKLFWEWHQAPCDRTWADGHVGNRPADLCKLSMVLSPYHLAYPIVFYSVEVRLFAWLGTAFDSGLGTYKGGAVTQFGIRVPFYPAGDFDGGLQVGPFVRAAILRLPDATSTEPPSTRHAVGSAVYNDVEFARSNGRNAIYPGILIGGKYIAGAKGTEFSSVRGLTLQGGFLVGYHALVGSPRHEPHALATRTESGFLPQLYLEAGYSL